MKALAIDTSNLVMGVSVVGDGIVLGEVITNLKKNHSIRLMPAIADLLKEVNVTPKELERIVVANGPGSYTGVRIGATTAKSMAWALNIPIVAISSLEVLAQNGRYFNGVVCPFFDARRGQVFTGLYGVEDGEFKNIRPDKMVILEEWLTELSKLNQSILFLSNDFLIHEETIREHLGEQAVFANRSELNPRPSELALLGLKREPIVDVHQLVPEYLRLAEAEANWLAAQKEKETK